MSAARLAVRELRLEHFRNHTSTSLRLDDRPVCLSGPNGAGKTNLLEAVACLAPGRGLRGAGPFELAQGGEAGARRRLRAWSVSATIALGADEAVVGVGLEAGPDGTFRRAARLDGQAATAQDLARIVRAAWVTPAMDRLFAGSPGDRRRFLDRLALARFPGHGTAAAAYERALRERSRLLAEGGADPSWLAGLEREMAAHGAALAKARVLTVRALAQSITAQAEGHFPKAALCVSGWLEERIEQGGDIGEGAESFAALLRAMRTRDAAAGRALEGPHRADLLVRHAPKDMPAELCSTGEQKALLLGLILAHARALAADPAAGPALLLLDEAAAHLDPDRRAGLFDELLALPGQSWLTGTEPGLFAAFGARAQHLSVFEGEIAAAAR